jgi:xanthine/uracil/vitamin C permease (AzgA family)
MPDRDAHLAAPAPLGILAVTVVGIPLGLAAFTGVVSMPLTYSIATGIGLGFITYAACKIPSGRYKDASPAVIVLATAVRREIRHAVSEGECRACRR